MTAGDTESEQTDPARSMREVAEFFETNERQIRRWKKMGCPALQSRPYQLESIAAWHAEHVGGPNRKVLDETEAEARKRRGIADADKAEWDAKIKERQYQKEVEGHVPKETVQSTFENVVAGWRRALLLIPRGASLELAGATSGEAEAILTRHVDDVLSLCAQGEFDRLIASREKAVTKSGRKPQRKAPAKKRKTRK
ncbi:MAG: hypothetical protein AAF196_09035 [Planctomycetota bacterium]